MTNGTRFSLRDLPLPAKLVVTFFLMAVGLGYISAMVQLHFKSGSRDGSPLPTLKDVVRRFAGTDWPPNSAPKPEEKAEAKKDEAAPKVDNLAKVPELRDGEVVAVKIRSLLTARCAECHNPDGEENKVLLHTYADIAKKYLNPVPGKGRMYEVLHGGESEWGKKSMVRAFTDKDNDWKILIAQRPEAELRQERAGEREALIAWIVAGAKKEQYDADLFPLPKEIAKKPMTEQFRTVIDRTGKVVEAPGAVKGGADEAAANLQASGPLKVKIQTLINVRCAECHKTEKKDTPLGTFEAMHDLLLPNPKEGKMHKVVTGAPNRWGKDSMVRAFTDKSVGWKAEFDARPTEVKQEREMEKIALIAWLEAGAPKEAYDLNEFIVPVEKVIGAITKAMLVGAPEPVNPTATLRQIDFDSLVQSTHAHLLTFALLWTATGLIFAFTSYPVWMRVLIAPSVLVAQVIDVLCWWLARLPDVGPYFAVAILGTGAIVGLGLTLQILLSLFNLYGGKGRLILILVVAVAVIGAGTAFLKYIEPELAVERKEAAGR